MRLQMFLLHFFSDYSIKFIGPVNTGGADLFRILILSIFAA